MGLNTVEAASAPARREQPWPSGDGDALLAGGTWPIVLDDNGTEQVQILRSVQAADAGSW